MVHIYDSIYTMYVKQCIFKYNGNLDAGRVL